jgi:tetratricopeptide (TPR) repeat protein
LIVALVLFQGCAAKQPSLAVEGSFETYVARVRSLGVRAQPVQAFTSSIESSDRILSAALLALSVHPGSAEHRRVAERYRALKILDAAYDHFTRARQRDPTDALSYDGLARIWRDWGFPHLGLADASRAVQYAPSWPEVHNTLGTILTAMGRGHEARGAFERALSLDQDAAYVLNNLCYLSLLEGRLTRAVEECRRALAADPSLTSARNNLALAYAADRRDDLALREFSATADRATASYNLGIALLGNGQYALAAEAFEAASRHRPGWSAAQARAKTTRALVAKRAAVMARPLTSAYE